MTLVLRIPKGSKLTKEEMDGNLTYLEGLGEGKVTATSFNQFTSSYTTGSFTGSFKGDGSGLTGIPVATPIDTTIFVTTSSFNSFTSSYISDSSSFDSRITNLSSSINSITGSVTINTGSFVTTSSFNSFTSSYTTGSFTGFFTGDGSQLTAVVFATSSTTASYALSVDFDNIQDVPEGLISSSAQLAGATIPGNFTVDGTLTSRTFESQLVSSSILYESGSTKFGDSIDDTHQFTGSIQIQGSITGSTDWSNIENAPTLLSGSAQIANDISGSFNNVSSSIAVDIDALSGSLVALSDNLENFSASYSTGSFTGSFIGDGSGLTGIPGGTSIDTGSFATTGSNEFVGDQIVTGSISLSDDLELKSTTTTFIPSLNTEFNIDLSGSFSTFINKTLVLGDGKVLVAGRFESVNGHTTDDIALLNPDGTVDTSFVATGIVFDSGFGGISNNAKINTLFVQPNDGKIIIGGNFNKINGVIRTGIARLNTNGTLDTLFVPPSLSSLGEVKDITLQNDEKVLLVGDFSQGIRRLNTDGTNDTSFLAITGTGQHEDNLFSIATQIDGGVEKILVGGSFNQWNNSISFKRIVRLNLNGSLDNGFASNNILEITSPISEDVIRKIVVDGTEAIYIGGTFTSGTQHKNIARLSPTNGEIDSIFTTYIVDGTVRDIALKDNNILIGGDFITSGQTSSLVYVAQRFVIVNKNNGSKLPDWNASNYSINNIVNSISILNDNVILGGTFTVTNGFTRENIASLKLSGFGTIVNTVDYTLTTDSEKLLVSSSNTEFSGDVNIIGTVSASIFTGSFVGDGSGLTGLPSGGGPSVYEYTGSLNSSIIPLSGSNVASGSFGTVGGGTQNKANGNCSTVGGGSGNIASGVCSTVAGGSFNTASGTRSTVSGGCCNITNARHSIIAGGHRNVIQSPLNECCSSGVTISGGIGHNTTGGTLDFETLDITGTITCCNAGYASTISGGLRNIATGGTSTVSGGYSNTASSYSSTVSGGQFNTASSYCTTVGGGGYNTASNWYSTVGGGSGNCASGTRSTVAGGQQNIASGGHSTISGGINNTASGFRSGILGGCANTVSHINSFIVGSNITSNANNTTFVNNFNVSGSSILSQVSSSLNFVDDAAAAAGGVPLGGLYRSGNFILIRLA